MRKSVYTGPCGECGLINAVKRSGRSQGFESDWLVVNSSRILVVCLWTYVCWTLDLNLFICKMRLVTFTYWVVVKMYWIQDGRSTWQSARRMVVLWWVLEQSHSRRSARFVPLQGLWGRQRVLGGVCHAWSWRISVVCFQLNSESLPHPEGQFPHLWREQRGLCPAFSTGPSWE